MGIWANFSDIRVLRRRRWNKYFSLVWSISSDKYKKKICGKYFTVARWNIWNNQSSQPIVDSHFETKLQKKSYQFQHLKLTFFLPSQQISIQWLRTRVIIRENLAWNIRCSWLPLVESTLHHSCITKTRSRRANHQRRRSISSMAATRRWASWNHQFKVKHVIGWWSVCTWVVC